MNYLEECGDNVKNKGLVIHGPIHSLFKSFEFFLAAKTQLNKSAAKTQLNKS